MKLVLDLHGYTEQDAYLEMLDFFSQLPRECREVTVIHGFRGGQVLKNMVNDFKHERIWSRQAGVINPGHTIIFTR
ncbi:MAG: Smr/MutS family protein [Firmicutes bacterium]|nr:Smr/MutS family protein [Bacillota bacterium]